MEFLAVVPLPLPLETPVELCPAEEPEGVYDDVRLPDDLAMVAAFVLPAIPDDELLSTFTIPELLLLTVCEVLLPPALRTYDDVEDVVPLETGTFVTDEPLFLIVPDVVLPALATEVPRPVADDTVLLPAEAPLRDVDEDVVVPRLFAVAAKVSRLP